VQTKAPTEPNQQSLSAEESSAQAIFRRVAPSIVVVETLDEDGSVLATGSGVVIQHGPVSVGPAFQSFDELDRFIESTESNLIVTNTHVIDDGVAFRVRQGEKTWPARLGHVSLRADLCRLLVEGLNAVGVELRPMSSVTVGERAYTVGAPEGLELTISEGLVSGLRNLDGEQVIQTSAAISHGSSGGGLFDRDGRLIGITTFSYYKGQNLNFALPTDTLLEPQGWQDEELIRRHTKRHTQPQDVAEADAFLRESFDKDAKCAATAKEAVSSVPDDWDAHYLLGSCLSKWDPHRALRELETAARLKPSSSKVHEQLGVTLRNVGDPYAGVQELREALSLDPSDDWTRAALLGTLVDDDDMPSAIVETREFAARITAKQSTMPIEFLKRVAVWMIESEEEDSALAVCRIYESAIHAATDGQVCMAAALKEAQAGTEGNRLN
jgi:hypothetical protein